MKSPMQTAFEKMTDEELQAVFGLVTDRSKGKFARLWVIESQLQHEQRKRGIIDKPHRTSGLEELEHSFITTARIDKYRMLHGIEDCPWEDEGKRKRTPEEDRAFSHAARARMGHDEGYGDLAEDAIRTGDIQFFKMAIKVLESSEKRRSLLTKHVKVMIGIYHNLEIAGKPAPTKEALKDMVIAQFEADGFKPFPFKSDQWEIVFERAGLTGLDQARPGSIKSELTEKAVRRDVKRGLKS